MLETHETREQKIADLEIHGWEPVKNLATERCGIYSEALGLGFSVRDDSLHDPAGDSHVKVLNPNARAENYVLCEWVEVTDWHFETIEKRLGAV